MSTWLLPENIADILPAQARQIEELRRLFLDHFRLYGYEMVMPPLLEYIESLLDGPREDLDLQTFKLVDQLSGRMLGVRSDITGQVARIDAHLLNRTSVTRLCYVGSVLHTKPLGLHASREPIQLGAEIYGHSGLEADLEIQELLYTALEKAGISEVRLDLCHVGILRAILEEDPLAKDHLFSLYALLAAKDLSGLADISIDFLPETREALLLLPSLYGDSTVLDKARRLLPTLPKVNVALNELATLMEEMNRFSGVNVSIDLADLRGLHYHSGIMFSAYIAGLPNAIARGGRYDDMGKRFGRARAATGFSLDLRSLVMLPLKGARQSAILAPWGMEKALREAIQALRLKGEVVIQRLPGHEHELEEFHCDRVMVWEDHFWKVKPLG